MTWARFGIASHGTLVEIIQDDAQKLVSCLPRVHIALLWSGSILPDFVSAMKEVSKTLRTSSPEKRPVISLITGPSRTSDIEGRLLYGVHGPLALKVLILDWTPSGEPHD
jgi:L-lactate dehydrogenase complex protein LldG